ncbi:transforming growth factor-beta-induced protein ig-h3-like [Dreissena polymorpha]|uniref:FAS1 domain-containing protein n=1 Tax=Dreissena polymorpha TaxID=45954 RepID=A0A9D4K5R6_DREPO|nr:transforming growth factor-beta-induced protein ig-h3-like [Dreissena polymorpha]KAH3833419.1 hypothetical protein DPMN_106729 [Dreissena polymorpha]
MTRIFIFVVLTIFFARNAHAAVDLYSTLDTVNATIFKSLVDQAGLAGLLHGNTTFTVLVPSDASFAKIPASDFNAIKANPTQLISVIKYHVISGRHESHSFAFGRHLFLNSTNGHVIRVYRSSTGTHFNQANATKVDVTATNGIIHVINTVLDVPEGTVIDILGNPNYNASTFLALVKRAGLDRNYANPTGLNQYTVFAPSNAAMAAFPQATLNALGNDTTNLRLLVEYHVHSGTLHSDAIARRTSVTTTLPAHSIAISTTQAGDIVLNGIASILLDDIEAENGIVHVISHVLMPQILTPIVG